MAWLDGRRTVVWHNRAFAQIGRGEPVSLVGVEIHAALGLVDDGKPILESLAAPQTIRTRLACRSGRKVEITLQPFPMPPETGMLCGVRDITAEVRQREKLLAIHRAGLELRHLTPDELARMSTTERTDLLKANIIQYAEKILDFRNLEVRLLDADTNRLCVLLSEGIAYPHGKAIELFAEPTGNGVTGHVAATGHSLCPDVTANTYIRRRTLAARRCR